MSFADELEEALMGPTPDFDQDPREQTPTTGSANQWLAAVARIERQEREIQEAFHEAVERMRVPTNTRLEGLNSQKAWFLEALEVYHETQLLLDPEGSKTIPLPCGTLKSRATPQAWVVEDEERLMEWCRTELPGAITVPVPQPDKLDKATLKRELKGFRESDGRIQMGDGTVVPGLRIDPSQRNYSVSFPQGE